MPEFVKKSTIPFPADVVYDYHMRPGALDRLTPPWEQVRVVEATGGPDVEGSRVVLEAYIGPIKQRWVAEHGKPIPGREFNDRLISGPFASWHHIHRFTHIDQQCSLLEDRVTYTLPLGWLGALFGSGFAKAKLQAMFDYRHRVTTTDLSLHAKYRKEQAMKVLVSGATGLVGIALVPALTTGGHQIVRLLRSGSSGQQRSWDVMYSPKEGTIESEKLEGMGAVVHLAGESIADGRWNAKKKKRIRDSRVQGTRLLAEALATRKEPPQVFVSASAIGFYGDRGEEELTEASKPGSGFLPEVCQEWEAAAKPLKDAGVRVVHLRFGVILSPRGGALAKMLLPFRMGVGGVIGSGKQYMSWIALDDVVGAIIHAIHNSDVSGPVNVVAPRAVTNKEYTKTLGKVLNRPTIFPVPAFAARLAFGEMAQDLLLSSARVKPVALQQTGYSFFYPELESAFRHLLGK